MSEVEGRKPESPSDPWVSVNEASERLRVSRNTIYARALRGELGSTQVAGRTVISRADVEAAEAAEAGAA